MKFLSIFELNVVNMRAEPGFLRFLCGTLARSEVGAELSGVRSGLPMQPKRWEQRTK